MINSDAIIEVAPKDFLEGLLTEQVKKLQYQYNEFFSKARDIMLLDSHMHNNIKLIKLYKCK